MWPPYKPPFVDKALENVYPKKRRSKVDINNLYKKYAVEIKIRDKLLGGKPKTENLIKKWLETRNRTATLKQEVEQIDTVEEEKKTWTGFKKDKKDKKGLYLDSYQIKGMVKEAVKVLKLGKQVKGLLNLLTSGFFIYPARVYLGKKEPDDFVEETAQIMSPRGPRSIIKRHDYVSRVSIKFEIWFFNTGVLTEEVLRLIFEAGQAVGLGTNRRMYLGQFDVKKFEEI